MGNAGAADVNQDNSSAAKDFGMILEGLADCIACCGNGLQVSCFNKKTSLEIFMKVDMVMFILKSV